MRFSPQRLPALPSDVPLPDESQNCALAKSFTCAVDSEVGWNSHKNIGGGVQHLQIPALEKWRRGSLRLAGQPL